MLLLRAILLFFIFITPLTANTIFDLIKIPNLKIYETNTENKLRYLYAAKPFRLGVNVKKNIHCSNPNKKNLDNKYKTINKNLNRYPSDFLKKINLKYIVLCENLFIEKINTAGIPNNIMRTLILDINFNETYFERAIHHEVFHIIKDSYEDLFNEIEWKNLNKKDFKYADCSTCNNKWNLDTYIETNGFFTEYSKSTVSEDMAEVFSHIIFYRDKIYNDDTVIKEKIIFIKKNISIIYDTFKF